MKNKLDLAKVVRFDGDGLQKQVSDATGLDFSASPSLTQQHFADETDVNNIVARFEQTGLWPETTGFEPRYGDTTLLPEFHEAQNLVAQAHNSFSMLDANVRRRFNNDPAEFLAFVSEPGHDDELRALGLLNPVPEAPAPVPTPPGADGPQEP
ncbi:internal scaffolding protein [Blackfly microvirus SF02]|uniref:Internal scaffolding protein n=1 Tax=Blackfly microvirus SF02 TaxID=2576452 RepID=A0A4P8PUB9_9VIRU|nr:internal scaffolding protein [Blackfly microvirus SF02]